MQTNTSTRILTFLFTLCSAMLMAQSYTATLTGHGQNPPVLSAGYGEIEADLKDDTLVVSGWFRNLGSDLAVNILGGAHIHTGYAGRNGSVAHALVLDVDTTLRSAQIDPDKNRFLLSAEQQAALTARALYINVHTDQYTGGELRGQLQPQADAYYSTTLFGSNQLPMVMSPGTGALVLDLVGDTLTVTGSFSGLSSPLNTNAAGGMHLHGASAGSNGGIEIFLNVDADTSGTSGILSADSNRFVLTVEQKEALAARLLYANVHSTQFGGGELRGQVVGQPLAVFRAYLAGTNQVPFVTSRADGQVIAELNPDSSLIVSGSFAGVRSGVATQIAGGAHIHLGMAGMNGGIQFFLNSELNVDSTGGVFAADSNQFVANADQFQAMMRRGLYVNLHSNAVTSGEIRGQLLPESQIVFNGNLCSATAMPPVKSMAGGLIKGELTGNRLTLSGTLSGLSSDIDTNILGGAHVHLAAAGSTGGVAFPVNLTFDGDLTRATLHARDNVFMLEEDERNAILARGAYVNVHTETYGSGEIRGQLLPESQGYFLASLAGSQQTNPVRSQAAGQVILELNRGGSVVATGSFNQLSSPLATNIAGGVHIHAGRSGGNGPVVQPLAAVTAGGQLSGTFAASDNR
ncbi:MAG: CHRD domain-containing protein, partial [Saprospiraceae bacterium]|nr:CHRD domain-containing protein [Saprospiraceae bacterium]